MKKFKKPTAFELNSDYKYNGQNIRSGQVIVVYGVINPEEEDRDKRLYQGTWRNNKLK